MLLIFDWDGTLSNSTGKIVDCLQRAAKSAGFPARDEQAVLNIIGLGMPEALHTLYPDLDDYERQAIRDQYAIHFTAADQQPSPFYEGVNEGLERLRDQGFLLTVATGKTRRGLDRVLNNLDMKGFFHGSRCADETASKPHPQMLNELLGEFSREPTDALMIGDTEYDMAMAEKIAMPRVAVSYGAHRPERLQAYKPLRLVDYFPDFVNWVLDSYA